MDGPGSAQSRWWGDGLRSEGTLVTNHPGDPGVGLAR